VELLQAAVNAECAELMSRFADQRDRAGHCALVRNGYLPARSIVTRIGPVSVTVPQVRDRTGQGIRFESQVVPTYVRRAKSTDAVVNVGLKLTQLVLIRSEYFDPHGNFHCSAFGWLSPAVFLITPAFRLSLSR
jgi:hypothetical protein